MSQEWIVVNGRLKSLADAQLSDMDEKKLACLENSFISQLESYSFSSFLMEHLAISRESYRPTRDGYEIGLTSASDTIRMIWAYLLGLIEVDRQFHTNHLAFSYLMNLGSKELRSSALAPLLHRAAETIVSCQQVIFATSEDRDLLNKLLEAVTCNLIAFDGKILRPI